MKKLIMAALAIGAAAMVNAATVSWSYSQPVFDGTGGTGRNGTKNGTVYFFDASAYTRAAFLTAFDTAGSVSSMKTIIENNDMYTGSLGTGSKFGATNNGTITDSSSTKEGASLTSYFAVINGDAIFLSDEATGSYDSVEQSYALSFGTTNNKAISQSTVRYLAKDGLSTANSGAGWYNVGSAVPEPTSGLLLLLGMAGLALRRRRA